MNKSLFGSKKFKAICALVTVIAVIAITGIVGITAKAQTERRALNIKSKGIFDYDNGTVVMDASDLTYLADEIDLLEETYKKEIVKALNEMSTYFMLDESITHDPDESNLDPESSVILPFGSIIDGILASQSIPTEKTYTGTLPGEDNETTGNISAATEESISLGKAAWVDGELIIGTGADNKYYYNHGYAEGLAKAENASLVYNYHQHTGSPTTGGGCYTVPSYPHVDCEVYESGCEDGSSDADGYITCHYTVIHHNCGRGSRTYTYPPHLSSEHKSWRTWHQQCQTSDSPNGYTVGCGKTTETIESATIVFK